MGDEQDIRDIRNYMLDLTGKHGKISESIGRIEEQIKGINRRLECGDKNFEKISMRFEEFSKACSFSMGTVEGRLDSAEACLCIEENKNLKEKVEGIEGTISDWKKIIALVIGVVTLFSQFIAQGAKALWAVLISGNSTN